MNPMRGGEASFGEPEIERPSHIGNCPSKNCPGWTFVFHRYKRAFGREEEVFAQSPLGVRVKISDASGISRTTTDGKTWYEWSLTCPDVSIPGETGTHILDALHEELSGIFQIQAQREGNLRDKERKTASDITGGNGSTTTGQLHDEIKKLLNTK